MAPQRGVFLGRELEAKIGRETVLVPFDGPIEGFGFDVIDYGQIAIENDLLAADGEDLVAQFRFCAWFVHLLPERNERGGFPDLSLTFFIKSVVGRKKTQKTQGGRLRCQFGTSKNRIPDRDGLISHFAISSP